MKILLTNYYGIGAGGAENSTQTLAQSLIDEKNDVSIATTQNYNAKTIRFNKFLPLPFFQKKQLTKFLVKQIHKNSFEIIHAQDRLTSFAAILAARKTNIPCIVHFRDYWFACVKSTCLRPNLEECRCTFKDILDSYPLYRFPWEFLKISSIRKNLYLLNEADKKIAVSEAVFKKMSENNIEGNTTIIPNPVDLSEFDKKNEQIELKKFQGKKIVLFCGRFSYEKGISNLLKIIELVSKEKKEVAFVLVGNGPLNDFAQKKIKEKKIENAFFTGNVRFEKLVSFYKRSDLVLFPSVWQEPFGRIAIEAMAAKKPVIASNVGGIKEIVKDKKSGFLIEATDLKGWIEKITFLLDNEKIAKELGKCGRKIVEKNFEKKIVTKKIIEVYKEVL